MATKNFLIEGLHKELATAEKKRDSIFAELLAASIAAASFRVGSLVEATGYGGTKKRIGRVTSVFLKPQHATNPTRYDLVGVCYPLKKDGTVMGSGKFEIGGDEWTVKNYPFKVIEY